jgi:hypothetical protein
MNEETSYAYKIVIGKPEATRPHGRDGRTWKDIKCADWIHLDLYSNQCWDLVKAAINL